MRRQKKHRRPTTQPVTAPGFDYTVYSDGAANNLRRIGGWACVVLDAKGEKVIELSGSAMDTTSNRMELTAILMGLREIPNGKFVRVLSDSEYCVKSVNTWIRKWNNKGWVRYEQDGDSVMAKNIDIMKQILHELERLKVQALWVKAHNGDTYNEHVDWLASSEVEGILSPSYA